MGGWPLTTARRSHRRKPAKLTPRQQALLDWLGLTMADHVAAALAMHVIGKHAGLIRDIADAEFNRVLPQPARRHLGDPRDYNRIVGILGTRDPDDAMIALVDERVFSPVGHDPEHLDPVRHKLTDLLGRDAAWYLKTTGTVDLEDWEPLAVRLGDLIGDQIAANALATSLLCHARLAPASWQAERKAARERWRRQATRYVQILDEQRIKVDRPMVQTVEGEGERRFG
jgi:hypothetical protein